MKKKIRKDLDEYQAFLSAQGKPAHVEEESAHSEWKIEHDSYEEDEGYIVSFNREGIDVKPKDWGFKKPTVSNYAMIPGNPHVGPGNPIYPWATNPIDEIARKHDLEYGVAKTPWDVYKADEKFMNDMSKQSPKNVSEWIAKTAGQIGINVKYAFEKRYGIMYPKFTKEQLTELRKNPKFVELERGWLHNTIGDTIKTNLLIGAGIATTTVVPGVRKGVVRSWNWLKSSKLGQFVKNKVLNSTGFKFKGRAYAMRNIEWSDVYKNIRYADYDRKNESYYNSYIEDFLKHYHKNIFEPKLKNYVKYRSDNPQNKNFRDYIYDFDFKVRQELGKYTETHKLNNQSVVFTPKFINTRDEYIGGYQEQINVAIGQIDETNLFLTEQQREYQYLAERQLIQHQYGEEETKEAINTIEKVGKYSGAAYGKLQELWNKWQSSKTKLAEHLNSYQSEEQQDYMKHREKRGADDGKLVHLCPPFN